MMPLAGRTSEATTEPKEAAELEPEADQHDRSPGLLHCSLLAAPPPRQPCQDHPAAANELASELLVAVTRLPSASASESASPCRRRCAAVAGLVPESPAPCRSRGR